ncbi:MAG: aminoacyl-tRNA hydrolase [Bacillota bacterium]
MKLIVGLGNPGGQYAGTRHNAGFMVIDYVAKKHKIQLGTRKYFGILGKGVIANSPVTLLKPQTYMNRSGVSVYLCSAALRVPPRDIVVIHDELDLPPGRVRVKFGGGSAGHKGVQSIIDILGTPEFGRIRLGIGRPTNGDVSDYVLEEFGDDDARETADAIDRAAYALEILLSDGYDRAMSLINSHRETAP